ncbi:helix-turn-helix transcriptional regulator [Streptomyces sp. F63]|uniref:helix-turn-helix domain-containing protein n=1 Tax=Streptomyces sp. F63 TaxID=2824887 RepID=UPI001B3933DC|nr:helix-turn-helix transcriptional regulator [Streptomyces sp. F63]MBQ0983545.1 helix-turn-helix transcriptional regulator [Streptomyces sp. F63]
MARGESETDAAAAKLARQAATALAGELAARGLSRSDLARLMGVSPGRVSQILSGDANLTVRSLAGAAAAMGARVEIRFTDTPRPQSARRSDETGGDGASSLRGGVVRSRL